MTKNIDKFQHILTIFCNKASSTVLICPISPQVNNLTWLPISLSLGLIWVQLYIIVPFLVRFGGIKGSYGFFWLDYGLPKYGPWLVQTRLTCRRRVYTKTEVLLVRYIKVFLSSSLIRQPLKFPYQAYQQTRVLCVNFLVRNKSLTSPRLWTFPWAFGFVRGSSGYSFLFVTAILRRMFSASAVLPFKSKYLEDSGTNLNEVQ